MTEQSKATTDILAILKTQPIVDAIEILNAVELELISQFERQHVANISVKNKIIRKKERRSKVYLDRELYNFLLSLDLSFMSKKDVLNRSIAAFGQSRAPSYTALVRVWEQLLADKREQDGR